MSGTYRQVGDYFIPNLVLPDDGEYQIGKYGRMRRSYLKEHRKILYTNYVVEGTLFKHLITDAAFQAMIRDEDRVRAVWMRIKADEKLSVADAGMDETWDSVKRLIPKKDRMREIYTMEAEYLCEHPNSGYLTEIMSLKTFPDYIDYLPQGCIVRKIGVMGYLPDFDKSINKFITMSKDEYANFVEDTIQLVVNLFVEKNLA